MALEISWRGTSITNIRLYKTEMTILITSATHIGNWFSVCARLKKGNYPILFHQQQISHSKRSVNSHVMVVMQYDGCRSRLWVERRKMIYLLQCFICFISWREDPMKWWKIELYYMVVDQLKISLIWYTKGFISAEHIFHFLFMDFVDCISY